jgi:hypothetical protein
MACNIERYETGNHAGKVKRMTFTCDHDGCDQSPTDEEIIAKGGMQNMGWDCRGGNHFCPEHRRH